MMESEIISLPSGSKLQGGKYKIIKVLGQGGFGITYLAEQTGLGMKVAIKEFFLKGSCLRDASTSEIRIPVTDNKELAAKCQKKFKSEARKIASLNNDHIVNIIDIFDENGTSYYVMKYLSGGSLADKVQGGSLPEKQSLKVIGEISDALDSIHSHGLLHLDIKPANILFDERGRAVLIDFGVSKYVDSQDDTTTTSSLVGFSRGFAPLEQVNATITSLTPATDLYALGATLYNLVVGATPPEASQVMDSGLPEMPSGISEEVKYAITKSMQPRKKDRPQNVRAFLDLLPIEKAPQEENEVTLVVPKSHEATDAPTGSASSKIWKIASALLLCATLVFGIMLITQKKGNGPDLRMEVKAMIAKNEDLRKQVDGLQTKEKSLNQTNNNLRKQVDDLKGQVSTQNSRINSLQKENASLKNDVKKYENDAKKWQRYIQANSK